RLDLFGGRYLVTRFRRYRAVDEHPGLVGSLAHGNVVDQTGGSDGAGDLGPVGGPQTALHRAIVTGDPDPDDQAATDRLPGPPDDLEDQSDPVLVAATELIRTVVGRWGKELPEEVAV